MVGLVFETLALWGLGYRHVYACPRCRITKHCFLPYAASFEISTSGRMRLILIPTSFRIWELGFKYQKQSLWYPETFSKAGLPHQEANNA